MTSQLSIKLKGTHDHSYINDGDDLSFFNFKLFSLLKGSNDKDFDLYAYFTYYLPILRWLPNYNYKELFIGDFLAGLSMGSFQMPLVMSFATSLAHLPPISGLYSIVAGACIYAIFGTVPILVVGAAPSTALIYGQTIDSFRHNKDIGYSESEISSAISASVSGVLLASGLLRLGFVDNVLSRALLKGFIAAMGIIMIISQLSTEMGLVELALTEPHQTSLDKLLFAIRHIKDTHLLTFSISSITLTIVMSVRYIKNILVEKYKKRRAVYIPELLMMVVVATFLCLRYKWHEKGVDVVGNIGGASSFKLVNPFDPTKVDLYKKTFATAFLCTILGYFDSTTATKALGAKYNYQVSSNRELIALGATNFVVSLVSGLPAFGAFGRSKINKLAGATTPMAGIVMAMATIVAIIYFIPLLYFLPECVLALTTTIIGITVIQDVPADLKFFWDIRGYDELLTFIFVFFVTIFWSSEAGVTSGVLIAVVRVVKHSTRSRIQILGRVPNTAAFRNADELIEESFIAFAEEERATSPESGHVGSSQTSRNSDSINNLIAEIEGIEGVLIIKIPEPLNFANVGDLKNRLSRIEKYGSLLVHPSQPHKRDFNRETINSIIIDCKGMTEIDSAATQVLFEIIKKYITEDHISVCFSRVAAEFKVRDKFKRSGLAELINQSFQREAASTFSDSTTSSPDMGEGFFLSIESALSAIESSV